MNYKIIFLVLACFSFPSLHGKLDLNHKCLDNSTSFWFNGMTNKEFCTWWNIYRDTSNIPNELKQMEDYFVSSKLIEDSTNYWNYLNKCNIELISQYGYENFKQTITRNYFTWVVSIDHSYASNLKILVPELFVRLPDEEMKKIHPFFTAEESYRFNEITLYFLNYILKIGGGPFLEKLEEPLIGNPPCLKYNGKRISQDIFNSFLEFFSVAQKCPVEKIKTIIEIGAGSGRTAFCFMKILPKAKYIIVDIPPALYVSQKYLSDVFPEKKVMSFRPFTSFEEIAEEYSKSDIIFITPDQLSMLPDRSVDLFLAIDCLHEMKPRIINSYFDQAERLSAYFYFKCWQKTSLPFDGISYTSVSYPVHPHWKLLFNEPCVVPSDFFHAFYQIADLKNR